MAPNGSGVIQSMLKRLAEEQRLEREFRAARALALKRDGAAVAMKAGT